MDFPSDLDLQNASPDPAQPLVSGEDAEKLAEATREKLDIFGQRLAQRRDEWIRARAALGLDRRWSEDIDQYNGKDSGHAPTQMMTTVEQGMPVTRETARPARSTIFVQVTRQKTNAAAARLGDVLLPTDERNFSVSPSPSPTISKFNPVHIGVSTLLAGQAQGSSPTPAAPTPGQMPGGSPAQPGGVPTPNAQGAAPQPGQPAPAAAPAPSPDEQRAAAMMAKQEEAKAASDAMQLEIEDCLDECDYNAEVRKAVMNSALLGTGVLKGPVVVSHTRKAWGKHTDVGGHPIWSLEVVQELKPATFSIDPRMVYPDPACGDNVQNGRGIFELEKKTPKRIRELAKQPAYLKDQLRKVIEEGPQTPKALTTSHDLEGQDLAADEVYEHWTYWGEIEREDLEAADVTLPADSLEVVSACVEMVNNTVVRAYLNPLTDGALPYDMFPWEMVSGSVWGYGVPYLMRAQQRVINAAWRMILDNAGVSSGPQIVVKPTMIQPADKRWELSARKIWYAMDDVDDVSKAFATFEFNSHQPELQAIIEQAEKLSDAETAVPMMVQGGSQGGSPETVGGMQMLMQSSNVVLKRLVKQFDDTVTKPHIRRYYSYLMEYSEKNEIKGDFDVIALGSSSLVVRDIQNQSLTNLLSLAPNPVYAPLINLKKLFSKVLKAEHIDPTDVMNTDAEIQHIHDQAAQNAQPDPRIQAAQLRSDADKMRTQAQIEMNQDAIKAKADIATQDRSVRLRELEMERDIEMLRVSQKENISVAQIKAQLAEVSIRENAKLQLHGMQSSGDAQAQAQQQHLDAQKHVVALHQQQEAHNAQMTRLQQAHEAQMGRLQQAHALKQQQASQAGAQQLDQGQEQHDTSLDQQQEQHDTGLDQSQEAHDQQMQQAQAAAAAGPSTDE